MNAAIEEGKISSASQSANREGVIVVTVRTFLIRFPRNSQKTCQNVLRFVHTATVTTSFFSNISIYMLLPPQCEHSNWSPSYPFLPLLLPPWMGIEPIHDGNGNDSKIIKIMPLPLQYERAFKSTESELQSVCVIINIVKIDKSDTHLSILCFDLGEIISCVWDTLVF